MAGYLYRSMFVIRRISQGNSANFRQYKKQGLSKQSYYFSLEIPNINAASVCSELKNQLQNSPSLLNRHYLLSLKSLEIKTEDWVSRLK